MAEWGPMGRIGHAGRAEARPLHLKPPPLERSGAERVVWGRGRAGSGSRGWS